MKVEIVNNAERQMVSVLSPAIEQSQDVRIAVAFVSRSGLALLKPALERALETRSKLEFLVGLDMRTTEPQALEMLYELSQRHPNVAMYCYASLGSAVIYHPKLYLLKANDDVTCIIGSSNLTVGGLRKNIEVNVVIDGTAFDEPISDAYTTYSRLKFHPKRVAPDGEFLQMYAGLYRKEREQERQSRGTQTSRDLFKRFEEKALALRHPVPTASDLFGWLELVYDALGSVTSCV